MHNFSDYEIWAIPHIFLLSNVPSNMINTNSPFGILSLNTGSFSAKFSDLQILLEALSSQNTFSCNMYPGVLDLWRDDATITSFKRI